MTVNTDHWINTFRDGVLNYFGASTFVVQPTDTVFDSITQSSCPAAPVEYSVNGTICFGTFAVDEDEAQVEGARLQISSREFPAGVEPEPGWVFQWGSRRYCVREVKPCYILDRVNFWTLIAVTK